MSISTNFHERTVEYEKFLEDFKHLLKKNGLKFTTQREVILETLYHADGHLSPEALHKEIQDKFPDLKAGIATVYRTLGLLENEEIVTSLSFGSQGKKYELGAKQHHDHMICTECGKITEFVDEEIEKRQHLIANELGFKMTDHSMQIYGVCADCRSEG